MQGNLRAVLFGGGQPLPDFPTSGCLAHWRFAENGGATCADAVGANHINLNLPTNPVYSWSNRGVATATGLVQTPSIAAVRTVALVYKLARGETANFILSGGGTAGTPNSGAGVLGDSGSSSYSYWYGGGWGVQPMKFRANGTGFLEMNRGGYGVLFVEFDAAYTAPIGFGGRYNTTTSRCSAFELVDAACWNKQLSSAERAQYYNYVRAAAKRRGIYLNYQDCPSRTPALVLWGESTADGKSLLSELSTGDRNQIFNRTLIQSGNGTINMSAPAQFQLGVNQQQTSPSTQFGPELGIAQSIESAAGSAVCIIKLGKGSTFLAPDSVNGATPATSASWNTAELSTGGLLWLSLFTELYDADQQSRLTGIGLDLRGVQMVMGLNDAQNTLYTGNASATYQGYIQAVHDALETYTGLSGLKWHVPRCHNHDPSSNATALAQVRQAQADFVTALGSLGQLMDTDALGLEPDGVHWNAAGSIAVGAAGYTFLMS